MSCCSCKLKQLQGISWKGYLHTVPNVSARNFADIGKPGDVRRNKENYKLLISISLCHVTINNHRMTIIYSAKLVFVEYVNCVPPLKKDFVGPLFATPSSWCTLKVFQTTPYSSKMHKSFIWLNRFWLPSSVAVVSPEILNVSSPASRKCNNHKADKEGNETQILYGTLSLISGYTLHGSASCRRRTLFC